ITYGGSMGGFGALAYADLVGARTVLSINPQTTLDLRKVPFETRFRIAQRQAWTGPYSDANEKYIKADLVLIYADMMHKLDALHVKRLRGDNIKIINSPFLGHQLPYHFQFIGILKNIVDDIISGNYDEAEAR